ncbi:serine/threonine-protein kinase NIM1 [Ochlerotatus camptorhynchus]|uniref:serine/threonine-protein kinase NIM1 n=1 Tax=Ochlerotatus camptorhynchus TaxID=644619 RepID=UPI0031DE7C16
MERDLIIQGDGRPKTPIYQRYTAALQSDPRCSQEVALGRRIGFYRFCGDIGRGNFSRVKLAVHQLTKDKVAIKVVDTSRLDAKALRMLSREVTTLEAVFHPFILRLFEVIETLGKIHLVSEWVQGGELYNRIAEVGPLEEYHAALIFYQLLMAVKYLHSLGYVHRDIKAENVLMISDERIKLADFGFSTQLINGPWQHLDTFCGSPPYAAPELFSDDHYIGGPVDIWALGILLYFMLQAKMPFKASTVPLLRTSVLKGEFDISTSISLPCCRVIQRILVHSPSRRPTIEQLLKCQWFEHAQATTIKNTHRKDSTTNSQDSDISEVPNRRRNLFSLFSTRGQRRQYNPPQSFNHRNTVAANQSETNIPTIHTIKCSTKRANSVLEESFLYPIIAEDTQIKELDSNTAKQNCDSKNTTSSKIRRFSLSKVVKKRISPVEISNSNNNDETNTNIKKLDFRDHLQQIIEDEHGRHVMHPTINGHMHLLELEARKVMGKLGISSEMVEKSVGNGPRSDIIGIYRITVNRLQKEQAINSISNNEYHGGSRQNIRFSKHPANNEKNRNQKTRIRYANTLNCAIL